MAVGSLLGLCEGVADGFLLGEKDVAVVGEADGVAAGSLLGEMDGATLREFEGDDDGASVGDSTGDCSHSPEQYRSCNVCIATR